MTRLRFLASSVAIAVAASFAGAGLMATEAGAARTKMPATGDITAQIPCNGTAVYDLTVTSFQIVDGVLMANGTVSTQTLPTVTGTFQVPVQASATCQILDLTLGPLHLDLLGLVVDLNQVHLQITAEQGPGNLLGNLLCAVAGLLDGGGGGGVGNALQQIVNLLNQILAAL